MNTATLFVTGEQLERAMTWTVEGATTLKAARAKLAKAGFAADEREVKAVWEDLFKPTTVDWSALIQNVGANDSALAEALGQMVQRKSFRTISRCEMGETVTVQIMF